MSWCEATWELWGPERPRRRCGCEGVVFALHNKPHVQETLQKALYPRPLAGASVALRRTGRFTAGFSLSFKIR